MFQDRERSRAYPVIDLEAACKLVLGELRSLGAESLEREALARNLGYETGGGGVAARKIGALVQYGFLDRHAGRYGLSLRGRTLQKARRGTRSFESAVDSALHHPPLFHWIFDRFQKSGEIPENLATVLARDYGITARASYEAANVFLRSARFAGVLDAEGRLVDRANAEPGGLESSANSEPVQPEPRNRPLFIRVTGNKDVGLHFPDDLTEEDVDLLETELRYLVESRKLRKILQIEAGIAKVLNLPTRERTREPKG